MENYPALIFININMFVSVLEELTRRQFTYRWWWLCAQWEGGIGGWGISDVSQDSLVHHCEEGTHHPNHNPWNGWASQLQRVTILLVCPSRHMLYMEEGLDLTNLIWAKMLIFSCFFFPFLQYVCNILQQKMYQRHHNRKIPNQGSNQQVQRLNNKLCKKHTRCLWRKPEHLLGRIRGDG